MVTWTDDKIDALAEKVDTLAEKVDTLETKVDTGFARAEVEYARNKERDRKFDNLEMRFGRLEDEFDALNRTLLQIGGGLIGTLIAGILTMLVALLATSPRGGVLLRPLRDRAGAGDDLAVVEDEDRDLVGAGELADLLAVRLA
jgi:outer membrane murein-binding lipoprotein Lpp